MVVSVLGFQWEGWELESSVFTVVLGLRLKVRELFRTMAAIGAESC